VGLVVIFVQEEVEEEYAEYREFSSTLATGLVKGSTVASLHESTVLYILNLTIRC